jgi:peptidase E
MNILATSGGFTVREDNPYRLRPAPLMRHALELSGAARPRLCYLATATGDDSARVAAFFHAFTDAEQTLDLDVKVSHLALYPMPNVPDMRAHLLAQDVIWVGGGSVANLLAVWRVHGVDEHMREAWEAGVVLAGVSAGSICWHVGGTTDSFGTRLRAVTDGLGLLPFGNGVHYDSESGRRPLLHQLVAADTLPASYATDDGVGLHYRGTELVDVVSERPEAAAYRVERTATGATETRLEPRLLEDRLTRGWRPDPPR